MHKVQLDLGPMLGNLPSEEELCESNAMEQIYILRKLKAVINLAGKTLEVDELRHNKAYFEEYRLWMHVREVEE